MSRAQVEDQALREALARAASQLYAALVERMTEADPEAEVVNSSSFVVCWRSRCRTPCCL